MAPAGVLPRAVRWGERYDECFDQSRALMARAHELLLVARLYW